MKGKSKLWSALLLSMLTIVFVRCSEDEEGDNGLGDTDLEIFVQVSANQDGAEGGNDVEFIIRLLDSDNEAVVNQTGTALSATATFTGTADQDDFDSDFVSAVSIANGESSTKVVLEVADDTEVEGEETLTLTLSAASAGSIEIASATAKVMDDDEEVITPAPDVVDISILADKFYHTSAVTFTFDDTWVTITSKDLPDHFSMYYDEDNDLYEAYDEPENSDFKKNPGNIGEQNATYKIPRYPTEATSKEATPFGSMGVTINSVSIFNQNAAGDDDIFEELNTFDQYEGHPAGDQYHYHTEPVWLTQFMENADNEAFLGLLLDGFPVYGTHEDGVEITNDDLDDYHGHFGSTDDFPDGIYHYHVTVEYPWINGDGFYGTAGTVTN